MLKLQTHPSLKRASPSSTSSAAMLATGPHRLLSNILICSVLFLLMGPKTVCGKFIMNIFFLFYFIIKTIAIKPFIKSLFTRLVTLQNFDSIALDGDVSLLPLLVTNTDQTSRNWKVELAQKLQWDQSVTTCGHHRHQFLVSQVDELFGAFLTPRASI